MAIVDFPEYIPDTRRVRWFMAFVAIGVLSILARLWYLQIAHGEELEEASLGNQRRLIRRVPPRGVIEDAAGKVIATNRPRVVVSVVPEEVKKNPEMLPLLAS